MAPSHIAKVLEQCRISPPPATSASARPSLPLTFFDLVFSRFHPVQRIFFYDFPHPKSHFLSSELPNLKHSLSLALHHFYPLAGRLTLSSDGQNPEIRCSGGDFVSLVIGVSGDDFYDLCGNHSRDVRRFHSLVPQLLASGGKDAVLAVQVTVFPNAGISIGTTLHHAAGDGSTYTHFIKTWASMCKLGASSFAGPLPFYDRTTIGDPKGLKSIFIDDLESLKEDGSLEAWDLAGRANVVRATFVLSRRQLDELAMNAVSKSPSSRCSPYALACGYVWACLVRARGGDAGKTTKCFGFVTGCRARLDPPVPAAYFGNCLGICRVEAKRKDLVGDEGAAEAAAAIWRVIRGLEEGVFEGAENWILDIYKYASEGALTVAGSPKLGVYEVDFGWGRPRKVEVISIERTGAMSLAESRDEQGGIEVGLALLNHEMKEFISVFVDGLSDICRKFDLR